MHYFQYTAFFMMMSIAVTNLFGLYWLKALGMTETQVSALFSISNALAIAAPFFMTWLSIYLPSHKMIRWSFVLVGCCCLLLLQYNDYVAQLLIFSFMIFIRTAHVTLLPVGVMHRIGLQAGQKFGAYRRIGSLGFLIGLIGAGYAQEFYGVQMAVIWAMVTAFLASIPFWGDRLAYPTYSVRPNLMFWKNTFLIRLFLSTVLLSAWSAGAFILMPMRMNQLGATPSDISWAISLCGITALFTLVAIGKWVDSKPVLKIYRLLPIFASLRLAMSAWPMNFYWFYLIQFLHILTWVLGEAIQVRLLKSELSQENYGTGQAVLALGLGCGVSLASGFSSLLQSQGVELRWTFLFLAILPLCAWFFMSDKLCSSTSRIV